MWAAIRLIDSASVPKRNPIKATSSRGRFSGTRVRHLKEKPNLAEGKGARAWDTV